MTPSHLRPNPPHRHNSHNRHHRHNYRRIHSSAAHPVSSSRHLLYKSVPFTAAVRSSAERFLINRWTFLLIKKTPCINLCKGRNIFRGTTWLLPNSLNIPAISFSPLTETIRDSLLALYFGAPGSEATFHPHLPWTASQPLSRSLCRGCVCTPLLHSLFLYTM